MWQCKCSCGSIKIIQGRFLLNGITKSCGCLQKQSAQALSKIKPQETYNQLTTIELLTQRSYAGHCMWKCQCSCGKNTKVKSSDLLSGVVKSCGCHKNAILLINNSFRYKKYRILKGVDENYKMTPQVRLDRTKFCLEIGPLVRKRDNFCCINCNKQGYLIVHHILKWTDYEKFRFDINNCVTLCKECHKLTHNGNFYSIPNQELTNKYLLYIKELNVNRKDIYRSGPSIS